MGKGRVTQDNSGVGYIRGDQNEFKDSLTENPDANYDRASRFHEKGTFMAIISGNQIYVIRDGYTKE